MLPNFFFQNQRVLNVLEMHHQVVTTQHNNYTLLQKNYKHC